MKWSSRPAPERVLLTLFMLLVAGAIVNVAVAWITANTLGEKRQITRTYSDGVVEHLSFPESLRQGWPLSTLLSEVPTREGGATVWTIELTDRIELACWPIWPGFAINTIFYAAILWLLFAAPRMPGKIRRVIRGRRGQCPACAYPIGSSNVCTECGQGLGIRG